ncbi:MAG: beta-ketoacyl-ACP synthase III [Candidatus Zixiibacteriota bacterium]
MVRAKITGTGSFVPSHRLTNSDLEKIVDTSDEWITTRTGISERRICADDEPQSLMSLSAVKAAMDMAGAKPEEIDLLLIGTVTPDFRLPSSSCIVQQKLGLVNAATMDIVAACAGFLHALSIADAYIKIGKYKKIVVVGAEKLSSITDYADRNSCVLFGDGAGAVVVEAVEGDKGVLSTFMKSDGNLAELLWIPEGGSNLPPHKLNGDASKTFIRMAGKEVYKHAVRQMVDASLKVIADAGLKSDDVTLMVPHQANIRIIESVAKKLGMDMDRVFLNLPKYGNTSAASVPLALDEANREGRIKDGDIILMTAFGGGLTWASALVRM